MTENVYRLCVDQSEVVRRHSLTTLVHDEIERHIVDGTLAPGDELNDAARAARLQASCWWLTPARRSARLPGLARL